MLQGKVEHAAKKAHEETACLIARLQLEEIGLQSKLSNPMASGMRAGSLPLDPLMSSSGTESQLRLLDGTMGLQPPIPARALPAPLEGRRRSFDDDLFGGTMLSTRTTHAVAPRLETATGPAIMAGLAAAPTATPSCMTQVFNASNDPFLTSKSMGTTMTSAQPTILAPPSPSSGGAASPATQTPRVPPQVPDKFTISIDRSKFPDTPLGAAVDGSDSKTLVIEEVRAGLLQEWNKNNPTQMVKPGDRIVAVNDQQGHSRVLAEALTTPSPLVLTIYRPRGS